VSVLELGSKLSTLGFAPNELASKTRSLGAKPNGQEDRIPTHICERVSGRAPTSLCAYEPSAEHTKLTDNPNMDTSPYRWDCTDHFRTAQDRTIDFSDTIGIRDDGNHHQKPAQTRCLYEVHGGLVPVVLQICTLDRDDNPCASQGGC
jgi:hypothetical protein